MGLMHRGPLGVLNVYFFRRIRIKENKRNISKTACQ